MITDASVDHRMHAQGLGKVFIDFETGPETISEGGAGVNRLCAEAIRSSFDTADTVDRADLRARSFGWDAPASPRRLFIDHGSFADASFWAYTAPNLFVGDTILV